jgi:glycine cleavage system H protein
MNVLNHLKYTEDHEWLRIDGEFAFIGVTDYAQSQLGDVVFVEVNTVGEVLSKGEVFGTIEAVKTVSDIYMPVSGEVIEFNPAIEQTPDAINKDPYGTGWIAKIKLTQPQEMDELLDAEAYKSLVE